VLALVVVPLSLTAPVVLLLLPPLVPGSVVAVPAVVPVPLLVPLAEPVLALVVPVLLPSDVVGTPCVGSLVAVDELTLSPEFDALAVPASESPHPIEAASTTTQPHRHDIVMRRILHPPVRAERCSMATLGERRRPISSATAVAQAAGLLGLEPGRAFARQKLRALVLDALAGA